MRRWIIGISLCGALMCASFTVAYLADRRLGVVAPWSLLLAPVLVLAGFAGAMRGVRMLKFTKPVAYAEFFPERETPPPARPRRTIEGFVLIDDCGAASTDRGAI